MKKLIKLISIISFSFIFFSCSNKDGCMDIEACNYDSSAKGDDSTCYYCFEDDCAIYPLGLFNCDGECLNDSDNNGICDELQHELVGTWNLIKTDIYAENGDLLETVYMDGANYQTLFFNQDNTWNIESYFDGYYSFYNGTWSSNDDIIIMGDGNTNSTGIVTYTIIGDNTLIFNPEEDNNIYTYARQQ